MANDGFTLIEIVVVFGLSSIIFGLVLTGGHYQYQKQLAINERDLIIILLQTARARAVSNLDQLSHGLALKPPDYPNSYVLFAGPNYQASTPERRQIFEIGSYWTTASTSLTEVVFAQLSGQVNAPGNITLTNVGYRSTSTIKINYEGGITW